MERNCPITPCRTCKGWRRVGRDMAAVLLAHLTFVVSPTVVVASEKFFPGHLFNFFVIPRPKRSCACARARLWCFFFFLRGLKEVARAILYYARVNGAGDCSSLASVTHNAADASSVHGVVFHCKNVVYGVRGPGPPLSPSPTPATDFPYLPSAKPFFALCVCVCV